MREDALHEGVVQWLHFSLPRDAFFFHPLQNPRSAVMGAKFKKLGMKAGIPDLCVLYGGKAFWLELKAPKKYCSPEQRLVHAQLKAAGCEVFVIHSLVEAQMALELCGIPLNAKVAA